MSPASYLVPARALLEGLAFVRPCMSRDETRPGVYQVALFLGPRTSADVDEGADDVRCAIALVATDGHRLAEYRSPGSPAGRDWLGQQLTLDPAAADFLLGAFAKPRPHSGELLTIEVDEDGRCRVTRSNGASSPKTRDPQEFPDYASVIRPDDAPPQPAHFRCNPSYLRDAAQHFADIGDMVEVRCGEDLEGIQFHGKATSGARLLVVVMPMRVDS